ncbi:MAG: 16S rRNA (guanine(527)-N(7))-methyltransferase RsmG [Roseiflexaceae bacterium]
MHTLQHTATAWGLVLSEAQIEQFQTYARELQDWNARVNLTAITTTEGIVVRHFLDSLRCALSWGEAPGSLIDIGTGAGFPGLPLKLLRPELRLTLVESIEKKAAFLRHLVALLGLREVEVLTARAEALGRDPQQRERYDVAVGRAVADLRVLAEYCLPLCRVGGRFLAPKGEQVAAELDEARAALRILGGGDPLVEVVRLPETEPRSLVVVPKIAPTPPQYPRGVGVPARRPLG